MGPDREGGDGTEGSLHATLAVLVPYLYYETYYSPPSSRPRVRALAGIIYDGASMGDRVMVFIDYQNAYRTAQQVFDVSVAAANYTFGQFDPRALGERIVSKRPSEYDSELAGVRVYRGMPDASKDPKGYGACRAQVAAWSRLPGVVPVTRPLRYPAGYPQEKAEEKGIDVELAVDFVTFALERRFDVGVVMSLDTDLKPAMEYVARRSSSIGTRVEVAAWCRADIHCRRLSLKGRSVWCHWLWRDDFEAVRDDTDYVRH